MTRPHHLSWDNFQKTVFVHGEKRMHRVTDAPCIELFGDGVENRIGILLEVPSNAAIPPALTTLALIRARLFSERGSTFLEVATPSGSLHRQFYHFAVAVAERVIDDHCPATEAIGLELRCFTDLLEDKSLLGIERQIGLLGELLFLQRLVDRVGIDALESWLGWAGEPHDFRIEKHEFEIKTTVSPYRVHTIHGTEQLVAAEGCSLHLVSVLLGPPGAEGAFSLASKVMELSAQFAATPARAAQFMTALDACGFNPTETGHYNRRFAMRRPMAIVPVNDAFPAISRPAIQQLLGPLATRIEALQYDVSVEGLEREDGTPDFEAALPL